MLRDTSSLALKPVIPLLLVNDQVSAPCQFFFFSFSATVAEMQGRFAGRGRPVLSDSPFSPLISSPPRSSHPEGADFRYNREYQGSFRAYLLIILSRLVGAILNIFPNTDSLCETAAPGWVEMECGLEKS